jgi:hypothetical protein
MLLREPDPPQQPFQQVRYFDLEPPTVPPIESTAHLQVLTANQYEQAYELRQSGEPVA